MAAPCFVSWISPVHSSTPAFRLSNGPTCAIPIPSPTARVRCIRKRPLRTRVRKRLDRILPPAPPRASPRSSSLTDKGRGRKEKKENQNTPPDGTWRVICARDVWRDACVPVTGSQQAIRQGMKQNEDVVRVPTSRRVSKWYREGYDEKTGGRREEGFRKGGERAVWREHKVNEWRQMDGSGHMHNADKQGEGWGGYTQERGARR
ncbi:hypothetical protein DFH06DRAFT_1153076 [Mycena polygramma]|nr:hypothetical protein DFH06DRAFT_1153076 [Mycena polygramma]